MTLALPGKSPRRKSILILAAVIAAVGATLLAIALTQFGAQAAPNNCSGYCIQVHKYLPMQNSATTPWQNVTSPQFTFNIYDVDPSTHPTATPIASGNQEDQISIGSSAENVWVTESAQSGYSFAGFFVPTTGNSHCNQQPANGSSFTGSPLFIASSSLTSGSNQICAYNQPNTPPANGSVIVHKVADPNGAAADTTTFSGTLSDGSSSGWGPIGFGQSTTAISLSPDTYTVSESTPSNGWSLVGFDVFTDGTTTCPTDAASYSTSNNSVAVTSSNTTLVCVMNTKATTGIQLAKTDDTNGLVQAGTSFHWKVTVTVTGADTSSTTTVTDAIPSGFTLGTLPTTPGSGCSATGNNVTCSLPSGTAAGAYTFSIPVTAPAASDSVCGTEFTNTANITALSLTASDNVTVFCPSVPSLSIAKSDNTNGASVPGGSFNWVITLTVSGATTTHDYHITDTVPSGLTAGTVAVSNSTALDCSATSGNSVDCTLKSGTATGTYTITIPVTVPNAVASCKAFSNQASFVPVLDDTQVAATNSNTDTVTVTCATINVVKNLVPTTDSGTFNLVINDSNNTTVGSATAVGNGGSTGAITVVGGTYAVGETGANGTNLANYSASISCVNDANSAVLASASGSSLGVTVANGQSVTCTITNTAVGSITVTKTEQLANGHTQFGNGWPITVAGCGINQTVNTTGSGTATFSNLPMCTYTVSENTGAKGPNWNISVNTPNNVQVVLSSAGANGTAAFTNIQTLPTQTPPPCTNCGPNITPTATPTPPTPTSTPTKSPTSTPTKSVTSTPSATPTGGGVLPIGTPSATASPTQPGSGLLGESTPLAPESGSGVASHSQSNFSLLLGAVALFTVSGVLALFALGRKTNDD